MTEKLFLTAYGVGEHLGHTYFRDFSLIPFEKLVLLLIRWTWNAYLFYHLVWLPPSVKKYFAGPD